MGRLIDADELLKAVDKEREYLLARGQKGAEHILVHNFRDLIDNAPTVPLPDFKEGYKQAILDGKTNFSRPQGEREFIEIFAEYVPDDICTYPEYRGKPYYSIHYTQNGEDFVGFGTYNPEVLSRYLRDYFFEQKGGAE